MPKTEWTFTSEPTEVKIQVKADREARKVLVWSAQSPTKDFREAKSRLRQSVVDNFPVWLQARSESFLIVSLAQSHRPG